MSTASFDPFHFLMQISPDLLMEYAEHHRIPFVTAVSGAGEKVAEECLAALEKEPEDKQASFSTAMCDIDEIATASGCDLLFERVLGYDSGWDQKEYRQLNNAKERSMYFYLHHNDLFYETFEEYNLENMQGWRAEKTVSKDPSEIVGNIEVFRQALQTLYGKECKGKNLKVRPSSQRNDRIIFTAYIEDTFANDLEFKKDDLTTTKPHKPVFMAYFLYRYKEGILEVKVQGGKERIAQLRTEFIQHILQETPVITDEACYDFERIRNIGSLHFPVEVGDSVDRVTLKGLRLVHNSSKAQITIHLGNIVEHGAKPIIDCLNAMHINLEYYRVTQFKIEVVFKNPSGKGRRKKVTVAITKPNICDLKDRDIDATVRRLLKKWKLDLF